ncbi:MAG: hypothetical protein ACR2RB_15795, partial [Gammaproteobacteria bacterium]
TLVAQSSSTLSTAAVQWVEQSSGRQLLDATHLPPAFDPAGTYTVGQDVFYQGTILQNRNAIPVAKPFDAADWQDVTESASGVKLWLNDLAAIDAHVATQAEVDDRSVFGDLTTNKLYRFTAIGPGNAVEVSAGDVAKNRVHLTETVIGPATAGDPTLAEVQAAVTAAVVSDTHVFVTGDDNPASPVLRSYFVDAASVVTPAAGPSSVIEFLPTVDNMTLQTGKFYMFDPAHNLNFPPITKTGGDEWIAAVPSGDNNWQAQVGNWIGDGTDTVAAGQEGTVTSMRGVLHFRAQLGTPNNWVVQHEGGSSAAGNVYTHAADHAEVAGDLVGATILLNYGADGAWTLPPLSAFDDGKKISLTQLATTVVTLTPQPGEVLNGTQNATRRIDGQYGSWEATASATGWVVEPVGGKSHARGWGMLNKTGGASPVNVGAMTGTWTLPVASGIHQPEPNTIEALPGSRAGFQLKAGHTYNLWATAYYVRDNVSDHLYITWRDMTNNLALPNDVPMSAGFQTAASAHQQAMTYARITPGTDIEAEVYVAESTGGVNVMNATTTGTRGTACWVEEVAPEAYQKGTLVPEAMPHMMSIHHAAARPNVAFTAPATGRMIVEAFGSVYATAGTTIDGTMTIVHDEGTAAQYAKVVNQAVGARATLVYKLEISVTQGNNYTIQYPADPSTAIDANDWWAVTGKMQPRSVVIRAEDWDVSNYKDFGGGEVDTGRTWIDGKPIVRRLFNVGVSNGGVDVAVFGVTGIETVTGQSVTLRAADTTVIPVPYQAGAVSARWWSNATGSMFVNSNWAASGAHSVVGWLEYTKR